MAVIRGTNATPRNVRKLERATRTAVTAVHGALGPLSRPCAAGAVPRSARGDQRILDAVAHWHRRRVSGLAPPSLGSRSVIVVQQAAETLTSFHVSSLTDEFRIRADQLVVKTLMVAFAVVQLGNTTPILGICVKSTIRGIHGMGGQYGYMPLS